MDEKPQISLKSYQPYFVMIGLLALTSIVLAITVNPNITGQAGVKVSFPDQVGERTGAELRFCSNKKCRKSWLLTELTDPEKCPTCDSKLDTMTIGERNLLPGDTILLKKQYSHPAKSTVFASIVLSSTERASIHRPERCLSGQGNSFEKQHTIQVTFEDREPLDVRVLELINRRHNPDGTVRSEYHSYYAYWFVGKGRETSSHYWRMFYMASDRILQNIAHRWAYISVSGIREKDSDSHIDEIRSFIRELYPHMAIN